MSLADKLARPELVDMVPYQSARRGQSGGNYWLNANESPGDGKYIVDSTGINRYPDFQPSELIEAYCEYANVGKKQILATRGADEGIDVLIRTFCVAAQDNILICPPTYGMYAISAATQGCGVVKEPLLKDNYQLNVDAIVQHVGEVKLVFICSPNNPTGQLINKADIERVVNAYRDTAIVVVDEAYIEYCPNQTVVSWLEKYDNLVILRTLSKAFALAGLRCGFTLASESIIQMLSKVIAPYPISAPVADIACQALSSNGISTMNGRCNESNLLRQEFKLWLENQSWCDEVFSSDANFILFRSKIAEQIFSWLSQQGILIRNQSKQHNLNNCLRISIGSENELELIKKSLTALEVA